MKGGIKMAKKEITHKKVKSGFKKYTATKGSPFDRKKVQMYGEELEKITEKKGVLKPLDVVEVARNKRNPLHECFDWDDSKAAEKYRLHQARNLINHISVIVRWDHTEKEQKAFFSVNETPYEKENRAYVTFERVLSEPELRNQMIEQALSEVEYWQEKYSQYAQLGRIFVAIRETKRKIFQKKRKVKGKRKIKRK